jgi:hypothetical protein
MEPSDIRPPCTRCGGGGHLRVAEPECNGGRYSEPCDRCGGSGREPSADRLRDDGSLIYNEPAEFDEAVCERRGRDDRASGVGPMDGPYEAGLPLYAWERGYHGDV